VSHPHPIRIRIGTLQLTAASALEARRLADALPAALERALRTSVAAGGTGRQERPDTPGQGAHRSAGPADRAAEEVAAAVWAQLDPVGPTGDRR
jgi:hypothetical protein